MADVELKGVTKRYPGADRAVLPALDLTIPAGEMAVLVGPSGCGKSTTLRIVAGLEEATEGSVWIGGRDVTRLPPAERDIAMVFQSYALYPHLTVFENMAFALRLRKRPDAEIKAKVARAAESLGLTSYLDRKPAALSGGQRQRVAIGRAVVREPTLFLFDEPLSNLDAKLRGEMRREIARVHREAKATSMYVTHDQVEAMTLADRIVVLSGGVVQQIGTPSDIYQRPDNRFVAGFFGTPSMSFLDVTIVDDGGARVANGRGFSIPVPAPVPLGGGDAVIGARPEAVAVGDAGAGGAGAVPVQATVAAREMLGAEVVLHLASAAGELRARLAGDHAAAVGDAVTAWLAPATLHWFPR